MPDETFDPIIHAANEDGTPKLTKDGAFAKKRGRKPGSTSSAGGSMPRKSAKAKAPAGSVDYRPGILGMFQMIALPLAFKAPADAYAVGIHAEPIAEALNQLSLDRPEVAAVLEKILQVGPYGLLISALVPFGVQLMHNHNVIPEQMAVQMGATPKRIIIEELTLQSQEYHDVDAAA